MVKLRISDVPLNQGIEAWHQDWSCSWPWDFCTLAVILPAASLSCSGSSELSQGVREEQEPDEWDEWDEWDADDGWRQNLVADVADVEDVDTFIDPKKNTESISTQMEVAWFTQVYTWDLFGHLEVS